MADDMMVKREGYWVPRDDSLLVEVLDFGMPCPHGRPAEVLAGWGAPGVRFGCWERTPSCDRVTLVLGGHHCEGPTPILQMSMDMARELARLLLAAVTDGEIAKGAALEPVPFRDITLEPCGCERPPADDGDAWDDEGW